MHETTPPDAIQRLPDQIATEPPSPAPADGTGTLPTPSVRLEKPTPVRWWIFVLAGLSSWMLYLHRYSWGVIKPEVKQDNPHLSDTELGWLDSAFGLPYAFGQVPFGALGDLIGPRAVLAFCTLSWSLLVAGVVVAHGFWALCLVRSLFGLAQAGAYPVLSKTTRSWFPLSIRTSVQGVVTALGRVGGACSSLFLATVLMGFLGLHWKTALVLLALPGVLLAVAVWVVFRDNPREHPWTNEAEREIVEHGETSVPGARPRLRLTAWSLLTLTMMLFYSFCSTFADQLFVYWIPLFLREGKGLSMTEMGFYAMLPLIGGAVGGIVGGGLNDLMLRWTGRRRLSRSSVAFTGKALAGVLVLLSLKVDDGRMVMVVLFLAKFFNDWSLSTLWGAITDVGGRGAGTVFGMVNMVGSCAMFIAGPIIGYVKEKQSWEGVFIAVAVAFGLAAVSWLVIDCTRKLVVEEPAH